MEGQPLEDCLETPDSLPPALPGNIAHLQVSDLWICGSSPIKGPNLLPSLAISIICRLLSNICSNWGFPGL